MRLRRHRNGRSAATAWLVLACTVGFGPPVARARESPAVAIPAQPMASALQALARQTGVNILFLSDAVRDIRSNPVTGRLDAEEAARRIVAGTSLRVLRDSLGGLIVRAGPEPEPAPAGPPPAVRAEAPAPPSRPTPVRADLPLLASPLPLLDELLVTSTRQNDTVNRVPLSVTAETQRALDQRGLKTIQDLEATAPAMHITGASGLGTAILAIRGVVQYRTTAATTGFYLDDTPLQRRSSGGAGGVNGTPLPVLFDLDRIEVLRGPQGTLFGSGSEGGTVRLIQPQPSLTTYSTYARTQASVTHDGAPSYEMGVAVGGPVVADRLGFRASLFGRHVGGFIDLVDPFTGKVWKSDANATEQKSGRLALTWAPADTVRATLSYVSSHTESAHALDRMSVPITQRIVAPALCYDNRAIAAMRVTSPSRQTPVPVGRGTAECAAAAAAGQATYQTPGYTLGPYNLQRYQAIENDVSATKANFRVLSFDLDAAVRGADIKSITSYIQDSPKQSLPQPFQVNRVSTAANLDPADPRNAVVGGVVIPSGLPFIPFLGPQGFKGPAHFTSVNPRYSFTQELRVSAPSEARPVSWVAGVFYSNIRIKPDITLLADSNDYSLAQFGITDVQRYGVRSLPSAPGVYNVLARAHESLKDVEAAAFGEVNYWVAERLKLFAGLRLSRTRFYYSYAETGPSNGLTVATLANGGAFSGAVRETPLTPRFGAQYLFDRDNTLYVSVSKGYRAGGVNTPVAQTQSGDSLARNFGASFTVADLPRTYASDSVWSYEIGAKLRPFRNVRINGSAYLIDWRQPQTSTLIPQSGAAVITNAMDARSLGFEVEAEAALPHGLTATAAVGLNRTEFLDRSVAFVGFNGVDAVSTLAGQRIEAPPVTVSLGARYDFLVSAGLRGYARTDWRYTGSYDLAPFGATTWNPDSNHVPAGSVTNIRVGIEHNGLDVNLFVNNLFEPHQGQVSGGRTGCALPDAGGTPACANYAAYEVFRYTSWGTPREIGLQIAYRR